MRIANKFSCFVFTVISQPADKMNLRPLSRSTNILQASRISAAVRSSTNTGLMLPHRITSGPTIAYASSRSTAESRSRISTLKLAIAGSKCVMLPQMCNLTLPPHSWTKSMISWCDRAHRCCRYPHLSESKSHRPCR